MRDSVFWSGKKFECAAVPCLSDDDCNVYLVQDGQTGRPGGWKQANLPIYVMRHLLIDAASCWRPPLGSRVAVLSARAGPASEPCSRSVRGFQRRHPAKGPRARERCGPSIPCAASLQNGDRPRPHDERYYGNHLGGHLRARGGRGSRGSRGRKGRRHPETQATGELESGTSLTRDAFPVFPQHPTHADGARSPTKRNSRTSSPR